MILLKDRWVNGDPVTVNFPITSLLYEACAYEGLDCISSFPYAQDASEYSFLSYIEKQVCLLYGLLCTQE